MNPRSIFFCLFISALMAAPLPAFAKENGNGNQPAKGVVVENTEEEAVPVEVLDGMVMTKPAHDRIIIRGNVSLDIGELSDTTAALYIVPEGKRLVIEYVQADAGGTCFYKWKPTVQIDRPFGNAFGLEQYPLDVLSQELFTAFDYFSAGSYPVAISAYEGSLVKFRMERWDSGCFAQGRMFLDARLEDGDAIRVP